jgi:hypothetical protein
MTLDVADQVRWQPASTGLLRLVVTHRQVDRAGLVVAGRTSGSAVAAYTFL